MDCQTNKKIIYCYNLRIISGLLTNVLLIFIIILSFGQLLINKLYAD